MPPFNIKEFCLQCRIKDPDGFEKRARRLYDLLVDANSKVNLTRISNEEDFWIKHIADSLVIARYFPRLGNEKLLLGDIGCGAGFPSLVLAMAFDNLRVTAIDSISKKTAFVESAGRELGLDNLEVITGRSRELNRKPEFAARFDIITARAVSDLRTLFKESRNLLRPDGQFIFYKTPEQIENELPQVIRDSRRYSIEWRCTEVFDLPEDFGRRLFVYSV
jgi:16S rRNA (guanine527-N7)-methyltransferase